MWLAFYHARGTASDRLIRLATGSIYSHVECVGADPLCGEAVLSWAATKRDGGRVRVRAILFRPDHWHVVHVRGADWQTVQEAVGRPYDVRGAVCSTPRGRWGWATPGHEFCSGLAARALKLPEWWTYNPGELAEVVGLPKRSAGKNDGK